MIAASATASHSRHNFLCSGVLLYCLTVEGVHSFYSCVVCDFLSISP